MDDLELLNSGYRYALSLCANPAEAEDLAQQGWLRLLRRYGKVPSRSALLTTVRRLFLDQYRRNRLVELISLDRLDSEPEDPVMPVVDMVDMERLLGALRTPEREALYLHAVEGYTAAEIAALTEQPRGTVLSLLHRARRRLLQDARARDDQANRRRG